MTWIKRWDMETKSSHLCCAPAFGTWPIHLEVVFTPIELHVSVLTQIQTHQHCTRPSHTRNRPLWYNRPPYSSFGPPNFPASTTLSARLNLACICLPSTNTNFSLLFPPQDALGKPTRKRLAMSDEDLEQIRRARLQQLQQQGGGRGQGEGSEQDSRK